METERAFGCTKEEFDKLYEETNGFNSDFYKNCQVFEGDFEDFIIAASKGLSENSNISKYI